MGGKVHGALPQDTRDGCSVLTEPVSLELGLLGLLCLGEVVLPSSQAEKSRAPLASCLFMSSVGQKVFRRFSFCFLLKVTPTLPVSDKNPRWASLHQQRKPLLILVSSGEMRSPGKAGKHLDRGGERDLAPGDGKRWGPDGVHSRQGR